MQTCHCHCDIIERSFWSSQGYCLPGEHSWSWCRPQWGRGWTTKIKISRRSHCSELRAYLGGRALGERSQEDEDHGDHPVADELWDCEAVRQLEDNKGLRGATGIKQEKSPLDPHHQLYNCSGWLPLVAGQSDHSAERPLPLVYRGLRQNRENPPATLQSMATWEMGEIVRPSK